MNVYSFTAPEVTRALNDGRDALLGVLLKEGYLSEQQYQEISDRLFIVAVEPGFWGRKTKKALEKAGFKPDTLTVDVVYKKT